MVKIQLSFYEESTPQGHIKEFSRTNRNEQGTIVNLIGQSINESPYKVLETVKNVDGRIIQHRYELRHGDVEKLFKEPENRENTSKKLVNKPVKKVTKKVAKKSVKKVAKKPVKKVAKKPVKKVTKKVVKKEPEKGFLQKIFGM